MGLGEILNSLGGKVDLNLGPLRVHVNLDETGAPKEPDTLEQAIALRDELARHLHDVKHKIEKMRGEQGNA